MIGWPLASFEKIKLQKRFYRKLAISFQDTPKLLNTELLYTLSICHNVTLEKYWGFCLMLNEQVVISQ